MEPLQREGGSPNCFQGLGRGWHLKKGERRTERESEMFSFSFFISYLGKLGSLGFFLNFYRR